MMQIDCTRYILKYLDILFEVLKNDDFFKSIGQTIFTYTIIALRSSGRTHDI